MNENFTTTESGQAYSSVEVAMTVEVPLSQGQIALIDAPDLDLIARYHWYAAKDGPRWYAHANALRGDKAVIGMHQVILGFPSSRIDHVNGNGLDNRRANIRLATHAQNMRNARLSARNSTGFKGVCWHKSSSKFAAQIRVDGKPIYLGLFSDSEQAALAYDRAALSLHGDFARLNFPNRRGQSE